MHRMHFPDRIVALGDAGKRLAFGLLEADWFVDDVLQPRPDPHSLSVTVVGGDPREAERDRDRIRQIRERIAETERDFRNAREPAGSITVEYRSLSDIDVDSDELAGEPPPIDDIDGADWWVRSHHLERGAPLAEEIRAKRSLGRALYAVARDDGTRYLPAQEPDPGTEVAILCDLGEGTGSGVAPDLARGIQSETETASTTLFGLLPPTKASTERRANAFAALSELEYIAATRPSWFEDLVLVPVPAPDVDGGDGHPAAGRSGHTVADVDGLGGALGYALVAYYGAPDGTVGDAPGYAPFTICTPQLLRYEVETARERWQRAEDLLERKQESLDRERNIYEAVEELLSEHCDLADAEPALRTLDRADLRRRLDDLEAWTGFDLFADRGYVSIEALSATFSEAAEAADDPIERLEHCAEHASLDPDERFVDDVDRLLAEVGRAELDALKHRREILARLHAVDPSPVREALGFLVWSGPTRAESDVVLENLETERQRLRTRHAELSADLESTVEALEGELDRRSGEIERRIAEWIRGVERDIDALCALDETDAAAVLSRLDTRLDRYVGAVVDSQTASELDGVSAEGVREAVDDLADLLRNGGVDASDLPRTISESARTLAEAKRAFLAIHRDGTVLDRPPDVADSSGAARDRYRECRDRLAEHGIFEIGSPAGAFEVTIAYDSGGVYQSCRERQRSLRASVIADLREYVEELPEEYREELEAELRSDRPDAEAVRKIVRRLIREQLGESSEYEVRKAQLESRIIEADERLDLYGEVIGRLRDLSGVREATVESVESYHEEFSTFRAGEGIGGGTYAETVLPDDVFRAGGRESLAESGLLSDPREQQRLRDAIETLAEDAADSRSPGVSPPGFAAGADDSLQRICVATVSEALDDVGSDRTVDAFGDAFDGTGRRPTSWELDTGGPWDVAVPVFVTGVVLDNVRPVIQSDGYYASYRERADELGRDVLVHHSYGLDDGRFVRRTGFLNLADEDDAAFYRREAETVLDDLTGAFVEHVTFE